MFFLMIIQMFTCEIRLNNLDCTKDWVLRFNRKLMRICWFSYLNNYTVTEIEGILVDCRKNVVVRSGICFFLKRSLRLGVECSSISSHPFYQCGSCPQGFQGNGTHCQDIDEVSFSKTCYLYVGYIWLFTDLLRVFFIAI